MGLQSHARESDLGELSAFARVCHAACCGLCVGCGELQSVEPHALHHDPGQQTASWRGHI